MQKYSLLSQVKIVPQSIYTDERGYLMSIYKDFHYEYRLSKNEGKFVEDRISASKAGVLRGFHGDKETYKWFNCISGCVLLVIVDYDKKSDTYLQSIEFALDPYCGHGVIIPPNTLNAHYAFDDSIIHYKWTEYYDLKKQFSVKWDDTTVNYDWNKSMVINPILSERDK